MGILAYLIEVNVWALINFKDMVFGIPMLILGAFLAFFYYAATIGIFLLTLGITRKPKEKLKEKAFMKKWGILYHDFQTHKRVNASFMAFGIGRNWIFANVLVIFFDVPFLQISSAFF
jgi:hypothetical protein